MRSMTRSWSIVLIIFPVIWFVINFNRNHLRPTERQITQIHARPLHKCKGNGKSEIAHNETSWWQVDNKLWSNNPGTNISACIIVRTHKDQLQTLDALLTSIASSAHRQIQVHVVDTGSTQPFELANKIVNNLNSRVGFEMVRLSNLTRDSVLKEVHEGWKEIEDYGYGLTDMMIEQLLRSNEQASAKGLQIPCQALHVTNGDNLMGRNYLPATLAEVAKGMDLVATNFVSRYKWRGGHRCIATQQKGRIQDVQIQTEFKLLCIDLAAMVFTSDILNRTGIRFALQKLRNPPPKKKHSIFYGSDGQFAESLAKVSGIKKSIIRRTLVIHQ